jgi:hypothetical protein
VIIGWESILGRDVAFTEAHATMSKTVQNKTTEHLNLPENMGKRNLLIMAIPPGLLYVY